MGEKIDPKTVASLEEILLSNVYTQEALVKLLEKKGIITKGELLEEIGALRDTKSKIIFS